MRCEKPSALLIAPRANSFGSNISTEIDVGEIVTHFPDDLKVELG